MNDEELAIRLERSLGSAPLVSAPEVLRQAVLDDRAFGRPDAGRRWAVPQSAWRSRGRSSRVAGVLAGLTATLVLVAALLTATANRPARPAASGTSPQIRVDWTAVKLPNPSLLGLGPMTELNGKLVVGLLPGTRYAGESASSDSVWSYDPATATWVELASPDILVGGDPKAQAYVNGLTTDGAGGLFVYGNITRWDADNYSLSHAMVWHSADGRSWEPFDLGSGAVKALFVRSGVTVAIGNHEPKPRDCTGQAVAVSWTSTDDKTWTMHAFAATSHEVGSVVEWGDRLVLRELSGCPNNGNDNSFWTSNDGVSWQRVAPPGFASDGHYDLVTLAGKDITLAYDVSHLGNAPLISSDVTNWHSGTMPSLPDGQSVSGIGQQGGTFLAVGTAGAVAASTNGETWRLLPEPSWLSPYGRPYHGGVAADSMPSPYPVLQVVWAPPIVAGDLIAVPNVTLNDGSYGFLLGKVVVEGPVPTASP